MEYAEARLLIHRSIHANTQATIARIAMGNILDATRVGKSTGANVATLILLIRRFYSLALPQLDKNANY